MAVSGRVLASHYAAPVDRRLVEGSPLMSAPSGEAEQLAMLAPGDRFEAIEDSVGWAWGYGGPQRLVGYVRSEALSS